MKAFMLLIYCEKKISTDNRNILILNLNNSAILFKIVHFECDVIFFKNDIF